MKDSTSTSVILSIAILAGIGIGWLVKPTMDANLQPVLFTVLLHRPDKYPLALSIRSQGEANWFLPVGTNPVNITRISLEPAMLAK